VAACLWALLRLSVFGAPALDPPGPTLEFVAPTNGAVFSTLDEIPIVLHASAQDDVFPTADVFANQSMIATVSYCCTLCPCFAPFPGIETTLQIPAPWTNGLPSPRPWEGWTNVPAGSYSLTARAVGVKGTVVEAAPVHITVLDLTLRISVKPDRSVTLVIPQGSLVPAGYDAQASQDLHSWTRLGPFQPGNVASFYYDTPPTNAPDRRFYRSVRIEP
jgi:hypothetical protein